LDDDYRGEVTAMFAAATRVIEDRIHIEHHGEELIGASPAFKEVLRQVEVVAPRQTRPSSSRGRPAPAKSCSPAPFTSAVHAAAAPSSQ
jgi:hypothetical protein